MPRHPGRMLDPVVMQEVIARLSPPSLEAVRAVWRDAKSLDAEGQYLTKSLLARARQDVADLERRFLAVDESNRLVKESLEAKLEAAMREEQRLEREIVTIKSRPSLFTESSFDDLRAVSADAAEIFAASTTTNAERKLIVRSLVERVIVQERARGYLRARLWWGDGLPVIDLKVGSPAFTLSSS